ncbi:hypothetical protein ES703_77327 [subsurface metagenome]
MERPQRLVLPKRKTKKVTLTLATDQIDFLDVCAGAVGQDRSGFLCLVLDGFYDEITAFAKGYAARILEQMTLTDLKHKKNT